ncbi:hypothetical protein [Mycolicibacterium pallens]|uniref:Uncharacterized protein n=1 Tax=Mycolicibacterium pallens TaxID=370524 RepID=A0ABX8VD77_9MYCO|nr:hypothetical protein [Mycolicibacterium pallens]QYL15462.1 hypothetical protein K0O64_20440 [Mycolicibacterium pallens]
MKIPALVDRQRAGRQELGIESTNAYRYLSPLTGQRGQYAPNWLSPDGIGPSLILTAQHARRANKVIAG